MKKPISLILGLIFCCSFLNAQTSLYLKIKTILQQTHPELITDNKLIAVNVWQLNDGQGREANKTFEKAYHVYQVAKLKGGMRGIIVVGISLDNLSPEAMITLSKDGIAKTIALKSEEVTEASKINNIVFDSNGNEVYKNLAPSAIFSSIQNLITR